MDPMGGPGWVKKDPIPVYITKKYLVNLLIYRLVYIISCEDNFCPNFDRTYMSAANVSE